MQQRFQQPDSETLPLSGSTETGQAISKMAEEQVTLKTVAQAAPMASPPMQQAAIETVKWRKRRRRALGASSLAAGLSLTGVVGSLFLMFHNMAWARVWVPIGMACFLTFVISLLGLLAGVLIRPLGKNPLQSLWNAEEIVAVGPLLEATQMLMPDVKAKAIAALTRLLPQMQAEDAALLTTYQRNALRRLLSIGPVEHPSYNALTMEGIPVAQIEAMRTTYQGRTEAQTRFVLGALHVLKHIGAGQEVALVERLATGNGVARNNDTIQEAAQECLPIVQARAVQERGSQSYLRAASEPSAPSDVLLRPSAGTAETDNRHLLRASNGCAKNDQEDEEVN